MNRFLIIALLAACSSPAPKHHYADADHTREQQPPETAGPSSGRDELRRSYQRQLALREAIYGGHRLSSSPRSTPLAPEQRTAPGPVSGALEPPNTTTPTRPATTTPGPATGTQVLPGRRRTPRSWTRDGARRAGGTILAGALVGAGWAVIARLFAAGTGDVLSVAAVEQLAEALRSVGEPPSTTTSTVAHDIALGEIGEVMRLDQAVGGYSADNAEVYRYYGDAELFAELVPGGFDTAANNAIWTTVVRAQTVERLSIYGDLVPRPATMAQALTNTLHRARIVTLYAQAPQGDALLVQAYQALTVHHRGMMIRELHRACAQLGIEYGRHLTPMAVQMLATPKHNPLAVVDYVLEILTPQLEAGELPAAADARTVLDVLLYEAEGAEVRDVVRALYGSSAPPI